MLFQIRAPEIEKARFIFSVLARLFQTELIQATFDYFQSPLYFVLTIIYFSLH